MDVFQFFDTFLPVVTEQVIDVPKIIFEDIPTRTPLREPQLVETLAEVPTESVFVEQTVDIPVPAGGGRLVDLQSFLPRTEFNSLWQWRSSRFSPRPGVQQLVPVEVFVFVVSLQDRVQQRHPQCIARQLLRSTMRMSCLTFFFFSHFPRPKKVRGSPRTRVRSWVALELIHAERSSNGSPRCRHHMG